MNYSDVKNVFTFENNDVVAKYKAAVYDHVDQESHGRRQARFHEHLASVQMLVKSNTITKHTTLHRVGLGKFALFRVSTSYGDPRRTHFEEAKIFAADACNKIMIDCYHSLFQQLIHDNETAPRNKRNLIARAGSYLNDLMNVDAEGLLSCPASPSVTERIRDLIEKNVDLILVGKMDPMHAFLKTMSFRERLVRASRQFVAA